MTPLKFEDIRESIMSSKNKYEMKMGIKTLNIKLLVKKDGIAFFLAEKSDNSKTLYFAYKPSKIPDHWVWICPNREHVTALTQDLENIWSKEKPKQHVNYVHTKNFDSIKEILTEISSFLNNDYKIELLIKRDTIALLMAERKKEKALFIALKPSSRFKHWYLFSPSVEQINALTIDLKKFYLSTDTSNEETRWRD